VLKIGGSKTKVAAKRAEAYTLANALKEIGEPHLGAAALICFEWLQRPENVLTGKISWGDYRSGNHVGIFHPKTGEVALQPLEDKGRKLYPALEKYLADLPRLGVAIVVTKGSRSVAALRDGLCAGKGLEWSFGLYRHECPAKSNKAIVCSMYELHSISSLLAPSLFRSSGSARRPHVEP